VNDRPLPPTVATVSQPAPPPPQRKAAVASGNRGCAIFGVIAVALLAGAGWLAYQRLAPPEPAASRTGAERHELTVGSNVLTIYDEPDLFAYADLATPGELPTIGPDTTPKAAELQLAGWSVDEEGWTERVAVLRPPAGETSASAALSADGGLLGLDILNVSGADLRTLVAEDGMAEALVFEDIEVNAPIGRVLPNVEGDFRTTLLLTSTPDDLAVIVVQLTWDDDHRPPEDELEQIRRSLRPA
jgi:hypothetical protein